MADRNIVAHRDPLYPQCNRPDSRHDDMLPQRPAGKDNDNEGRPRFGQRSMPDQAFFERVIENAEVQRDAFLAVAPEDEEGSVRQRFLLADTEGRAAVRNMVDGMVADDWRRHVRPLHVPEDVLGRLQQGAAIDPSAYVDLLSKSQ